MAKSKAQVGANLPNVSKDEVLLNQAINMIINAEQGILVDPSGKVVKDFRYDMQRMQNVFDAVEKKRVEAFTAGRSMKGGMDVRISSQDIKAVLFKPISRQDLQNPNILEGRSQFRAIWNLTRQSLYDELGNITEERLQRAFENAYDELKAFERYILSQLSDNPKEWDKFIDAILQQIPTAFGPPSP